MEENIVPAKPRKTSKFKKLVLYFFSALILIAAYFLICAPLHNSYTQPTQLEKDKSIAEDLQRIAEEKNKSLPAMVDGSTEWTSVNASGNEITQDMRITVDDAVITQSWIDEELKPKKIAKACADPTYRNWLERGVIIIFKYYNKNYELGGSVTIKLSDCT